jgi:hypothetical protein
MSIPQSLPLNELQVYVYNTIKSITGASVYDHVPDDAAYPYYAIGDCTVDDKSSKTHKAVEVTHQIMMFSSSLGQKEVFTMANNVLEKFVDSLRIELNGFQIIDVQLAPCTFSKTDEIRIGEINLRFHKVQY